MRITNKFSVDYYDKALNNLKKKKRGKQQRYMYLCDT